MKQLRSSAVWSVARLFLVLAILSLAAASALAYWPSPAPTEPAKGAKIADPSYGNLILRVTDSSDGANMGTSYSYWPTFSKNNGHIAFFNLNDGSSYCQDFDPVNFQTVGAKRALYATNPPSGGAPEWDDGIWSGSDDNVICCHAGTYLWKYNVNTQAWTLVKDLAGRFLAGTAMFRQMSKSTNDDVFAFSLQNASYAYIGYGVYKVSTDQVLVNVSNTSFDEVQIDKSGRYLAAKLNSGDVIVYDTQLGTNTTLTDGSPDFAPGHSDNGTGTCVGHDNYNNQITFRNLGTPHSFSVVYNWGSNWNHGEHISFQLDDEAWVELSTFDSGVPPNNTLRAEVFLIRTNGTGEVRHICHHYSNYVSYYDSPRANISRDGKYIAFTSNWGASGRLDLFIVQVPAYGPSPPVANFTGNPTSGAPPLTVAFTDASTNSPTSWSWNFGDSSTSTAQSPSHVYSSTGSYTVSLRATNAAGYDDEVKTNYITVSTPPSPPVANFSGTPTSGTAPLAVAFTDSSTNSPTSWSWNFGDSSTSTAQSPSHTYNSAGAYTVSLRATNAGGYDDEVKTSYITVSGGGGSAPTFVAAGAVASNAAAITPALPAGIAANDILLLCLETANQAVSISNQNGGTWTEVTNSPQGTGSGAGSGATRLTVFWSRYNGTQGAPTTSDSGDHQLGRIIAIRGCVTSGNPWDVTAGGVESAVDTSGAIPGATTTVANTLVVAAIATALPDADGTADFSAWTNANLTSLTERTDNTSSAGNGGGLGTCTGVKAAAGAYGATAVTCATAAKKGLLSIALKPGGGGSPPVANFTGTPTSGTAPLAVAFTDSSTNTPTSWNWTFGDSSTSTAQNPSHTYAAGTYTVALTATNAYGNNTMTKTNYITASGATYVYVYPDTWTVNSYTPGVTLQSGGLTDLQSDNAVYMVVRCDTSTQRCGVMYTVDTPYTPSQVNKITWEYQAKVSRSDTPSSSGNLFVRKADGSWEARPNWVPGTTDTDWTWNSTAVSTYMSSTGVIGFELCCCPTTGNTNNYDVSSDLLRFRLDLN